MGIWSKVLIVAIGLLALSLGRLSPPGKVGVGLALVAVVGYLTYRGRRGFSQEFVRGNLLYLLPGHWLLLLGLVTMGAGVYRPYLVWAWLPVVLGTLAFDALAQSGWDFPRRKWGCGLLYGLIWADVFFLLHQWVLLGGRLSPGARLPFSAGMAAFALVYLATAMYRFANLQPLKG